ncbi:hypothetical protein RSK20926_11889 [Roseobacter sp. SK209-2-6]|uniref:hypothetical protein n=1 Tax=Roseobacter sp. SK209-2-6 TaxID=388739 RepID=UPI0000F3C619|nr:hypothetical protein [Roseobacter sp. SK209-2-6]EBA18419.1 hypothetical protein RSK20926_11889 [Roseobacter sp. SK209-2-6]
MTITARAIPENSTKIAMKSGGAEFHIYEDGKGRPCVVYYRGKSSKMNAFYFKTEERRASHIEGVIKNITAAEKRKAEERAARNKAHNMEPGLILYTSWGYDQTNVEFYQVVEVPSRCYVILQQISAPLARGEESFMSGNSVPNPENKIGEPFRRKVNMSGSRPSVKIDNVATAWIWDGKEKHTSWYA